jgi:tetratricopeptide (TPR) repeat protein
MMQRNAGRQRVLRRRDIFHAGAAVQSASACKPVQLSSGRPKALPAQVMNTELGESQLLRALKTPSNSLRRVAVLATGCFAVLRLFAAPALPDARLEQKSGLVNFKLPDKEDEFPAVEGQAFFIGYRVRTLTNSHATVWLRTRHPVKLGERSTLDILSPSGQSGLWLKLWRGSVYFFSREKPRDVQIDTPSATGGHLGTEFLVFADEERTFMAVYDGKATLTNQFGGVEIAAGQMAEARAGQAPAMVLKAENIVQWWLYYPGVLDADDLDFTAAERINLGASLEAYRAGDLSRAFAAYPSYPSPADPATEAGRIYLAGLLLSAGQVGKAETLLGQLKTNASPAEALRWVIAAVQGNVDRSPEVRTSASEWLGLSYYYQARHELEKAREAAQKSVAVSTNFALGWERVAELEFSFGNIRAAQTSLERSLQLASNNAQAHALKGFLLSADNRMKAARESFERAIQLDSSLGNAWLGRGLGRIRTGDEPGGRMDLQTAAVLDPDRAFLRSYLGKAFSDVGEPEKAELEFQRAKELDPKDPTPWLYSALHYRDERRVNEAVTNLEWSLELNDNRAVYRSRFLLDQDRAVRSSGLALVYRDAGLTETSVREAARAVSDDYANASAHLFLSDSFNALRDPTRFNLRYETVWFNERLLANLLGPAGSVSLSQSISQQEYTRMFERDRLGLSNATEYRSDGQWRENASQFGTFGPFSYSLDLDYQHNGGVRPNNELDRIEWYSTLKYQVTSRDSALILAKYQDYHSGDNFQYYDPAQASRYFTYDEQQAPLIVGGWNHEWAPGVNTLFLGGRLENDQQFSDRNVPELVLFRDTANNIVSVGSQTFDIRQDSQLEIYTAELNQIIQRGRHTLVLGGRVQAGDIQTHSLVANPGSNTNLFNTPPADTHIDEDYFRGSAYAYYTLELPTRLRLTGGVAYDNMRLPSNFRIPPVSAGEESRDQLSPKAALVWDPADHLTLRGIYAKSLGGLSLDESFRLEPTQLAGFPQSFRNIISESAVGSVAAPEYEVIGGGIDFKLQGHVYAGVQYDRLSSDVRQTAGVFDYINFTPPIVPGSTRQNLDYQEQDVTIYLNKLVGREWAIGGTYRYTWSELAQSYPEIPAVYPGARRLDRAELHNVNLFLLYNHTCGFFARAEALIYWQHNVADSAGLEDDSFYQVNLWTGWRFPRQRVEFSVGVLNLNDTDYRLNPITPYSELPRERVFATRLLFSF